MRPFTFYFVAAIVEVGGCFAFWGSLRLGKSMIWVVPGVASLVVFAFMLTRIDTLFAGRAFAAYGGVYITTSLLWLWLVEGRLPDRWDFWALSFALPVPAHPFRSLGAGVTPE